MDCWSLCENRLGGSGTLRARYSARVVGTIIGPTLAMIAVLPASKLALASAMAGCSAKLRPAWGEAGTMDSRPFSLPGAPSCMPPVRIRVYSLHDDGSVATTMLPLSLPPNMNRHTSAR